MLVLKHQSPEAYYLLTSVGGKCIDHPQCSGCDMGVHKYDVTCGIYYAIHIVLLTSLLI